MDSVFSFSLFPLLGALYATTSGRLLLTLLYFILFIFSLALIFGRDKKDLLPLFIGLPLGFLTIHDLIVLLSTIIRL